MPLCVSSRKQKRRETFRRPPSHIVRRAALLSRARTTCFPGEGRGPAADRSKLERDARYIRQRDWTPAFAGEAPTEVTIDYAPNDALCALRSRYLTPFLAAAFSAAGTTWITSTLPPS